MKSVGKQSVDIPLGIAVDYHIGWSFEKAIRDFIQNFYDAVGTDRFAKDVKYSYVRESDKDSIELVISSNTSGFSYDLLTYIGASTKTNEPRTIGKYGEGFKMSVLSVYNMGMSLTMHSDDWLIRPASYFETIDEQEVELLGYKLDKCYADGKTVLRISGIPSDKEQSLADALLDFFYPENVLLGEMIGSGEKYTVYRRSDIPIPCRQSDSCLKGVLYINNMARGRLDIPIVINYMDWLHGERRSRPVLKMHDTVRELYCCMELWDALTSAEVLRLMKDSWHDEPPTEYKFDTHYYYICQLVRNIAKDKVVAGTFFEEMNNYCYLEKKTCDSIRNTYIEEAGQWWRATGDKKIVNPIFRLLGAENVVERYLSERDKKYRELTIAEKKRYDVMTRVIAGVIPVINEDDIPVAVVDLSGKEKLMPLQFAVRVFGKNAEAKGRKYRINKLVMQETDFKSDAFCGTFLKLTEALMQIYGSVRSERYNALFTHVGTFVLSNAKILKTAEEIWTEIREVQ